VSLWRALAYHRLIGFDREREHGMYLIAPRRAGIFAACALLAGAAHAQVVRVPPTPQIGSSNPITAQPPVPRPHTRPCVVQLFRNLAFADFTPQAFSYAPPANCPGPWAKVVFTADFTVTAGRQFDRTAAFYLGQASIYYGTTAEPRATLSPSWHVERDVTDLTAVFTSAQTGEANLGNFVGVSGGVTYNGIIYADAALEFYPASAREPAPRTPDVVAPVNGPSGDAGTLNSTASQITQTLDLPRNTERVYLDVIAQSQSNDEFWYFCVPNSEAANLESCGNTPFRETEVSIDGQPAGVAPVYPWIYTGGIDPFLWEPIPGVQTLDFVPYRVDLTPFAGLLADGNPHVLAISVYNADSYFLATANLLAYTDHGAAEVRGGLLSNTLSAPQPPLVTNDISVNPSGPTYTGSILVTSQREFAISGYVDTSHGRVLTTLEQHLSYLNRQEFDVNPTTDIQNVQQLTRVDSVVSTRAGTDERVSEQHFTYPLILNYSFVVNPDGTATQVTTSDQRDLEREARADSGGRDRTLDNHVRATDTLQFDANLNILGNSGSQTTQTYRMQELDGGCYSRTLTAQAQKLIAVSDGRDCRAPPR
jgi:Peptide N-acetyl-beta-D-glucosaminyl asparaginase amidase A